LVSLLTNIKPVFLAERLYGIRAKTVLLAVW